jgi:hypothetical protein
MFPAEKEAVGGMSFPSSSPSHFTPDLPRFQLGALLLMNVDPEMWTETELKRWLRNVRFSINEASYKRC